jgi:hypothetical protein
LLDYRWIRIQIHEAQKHTDPAQCCGSGINIPDPDFYPNRIPDPKTATKERGEKKMFMVTIVAIQKPTLYCLREKGKEKHERSQRTIRNKTADLPSAYPGLISPPGPSYSRL